MPTPPPYATQNALEALKRKDFSTARALMSQLDMARFDPVHFSIKGLAELALWDWPGARETFTAATKRFPNQPALWFNRGIAEENMLAFTEAIESQKQCIKLDPKQAEAHGNLSNLYRVTGKFDLAEQMARRAIELGAPKANALNSLGLALGKLGRQAEAEAAFEEAMQFSPVNPFTVHNRANLAIDRLKFAQAWPLFAQARAIGDNAVFQRDEGMARLLFGDFAKGWELYESRLQTPNALRLKPACPIWRGEELKGKKLLILAEQGFGDVLQFCRYQSLVKDADLVWAAPTTLARLLAANLRGQVCDETAPLPDCDFYIPIMSLPHATKQLQPLEGKPYIKAKELPTLLSGKHKKKIGLVWAGAATNQRDHERSIPLAMLAFIVKDSAADFYAPFLGPALNQIGALPIARLDDKIKDFADTAGLLKQMDCVVTVDTAIAHLAGAMGIPTFLLLTHSPDWRWGVSGETTPWYKSMRIIRQPAYGDWLSVVERLARELK